MSPSPSKSYVDDLRHAKRYDFVHLLHLFFLFNISTKQEKPENPYACGWFVVQVPNGDDDDEKERDATTWHNVKGKHGLNLEIIRSKEKKV